MSEVEHRFVATILEGRGGGAAVEVPFSVRDVYGTGGRLRVEATFDGHEYRGPSRRSAATVPKELVQETRDRRASKAVEMIVEGKCADNRLNGDATRPI